MDESTTHQVENVRLVEKPGSYMPGKDISDSVDMKAGEMKVVAEVALLPAPPEHHIHGVIFQHFLGDFIHLHVSIYSISLPW